MFRFVLCDNHWKSFPKIYLLAKCFTIVYVSKEGLEGERPGSTYKKSFAHVAIELSISPRYNINFSLLLSRHPDNTKIIKFSFVIYAYFNFGNIYNMDSSFKL